MSQSLAKVLVHIVYSTKHRQRSLDDPMLRSELYALRCPELFGRNCASLNGRRFGEDGRALGTAWKAQENAGGVVCRPRWC